MGASALQQGQARSLQHLAPQGPCVAEWKHLPQPHSALFMEETVGADQVAQLVSDEVKLVCFCRNPHCPQPQPPKCLDLWSPQRLPGTALSQMSPPLPREASGQDTTLGLRAQVTAQEQAHSSLYIEEDGSESGRMCAGNTHGARELSSPWTPGATFPPPPTPHPANREE